MARFGINVNQVKGVIPSEFKPKGLTAMRPIILNQGLAIVTKMAPPIFAEVATFSDACPNPDRLEKIIEKRNNIVDQANSIAEFLTTIFEALSLASTILGIIITIIKVVKLAKGIVQKIAAFIPISPGAIPSGIGIVGDALNDAVTKADGSPRIVPVKNQIDGLLIPLGIVIAAIATLVAALSGLDGAITDCVNPAPNPGGGENGNNEGDNPTQEVLRGPILTVNIEDPGKNYENGTYDDVKLVGGDGSGARANIKVQDNKVTKVTVINGGSNYSKELFDPKKGFQNPNYLTVPDKRLGKIRFNADELLETVDLKKKIVRKLEKQKVIGEGLLLSVKEIGASSDSGGLATGNLNAGAGGGGTTIDDDSNTTGNVGNLGISNSGGGLDNGTFENVPLTGGSGNGALATIVVSGGGVSQVAVTNGGDDYKKGDALGIPKDIANSNKTGVGVSFSVESVDPTGINGDKTALGPESAVGGVGNLDISSGGQNYVDGNYRDVPLEGGSGEGLTAGLTITNGSVGETVVTNGGDGYKENDTFSIPANYLDFKVFATGESPLNAGAIGQGNEEGALSTNKNALFNTAQVNNDFPAFSAKSVPQSFSSKEGSGATFDLVFSGPNGQATLSEVTVANPGTGYSSGEQITITNTDLKSAGIITAGIVGNQGTGDLTFVVTPNSLAEFSNASTTGGDIDGPLPQGESLPIARNISNGTSGFYPGVDIISEDGGNGGRVDITVDDNGAILSAIVSRGGDNYEDGNVLAVPSNSLGAGSGEALLGVITDLGKNAANDVLSSGGNAIAALAAARAAAIGAGTGAGTGVGAGAGTGVGAGAGTGVGAGIGGGVGAGIGDGGGGDDLAGLGQDALQSSNNNNTLNEGTGNNNTAGQITAGTGGKGVVGVGTGGVDIPIGASNGTGAEIGVANINPSPSPGNVVSTPTGLALESPLSAVEYASREEKLQLVLQGGPLLVEGDDGEIIELPGLLPLSPTLTLIARGAQEAAETENETTYKGFILDIETRVFSPTLTQRRAIAINPSGIVVASTEFSFATAEDVLIEDLKLIIDEQDLRASYANIDLGDQITSTESEVKIPDTPKLVGES
jgi:hypothetical protein